MVIRLATPDDIASITTLAEEIWWNTYLSILPADQIEFMLRDMYSGSSLQKQMEQGATFLVAESREDLVAFASYSTSGSDVYRIHKLYVSPGQQGKGIGAGLLDFIKKDASACGLKFLELNVNRNNPALGFYQKYGFDIFAEVDIPYHRYILNDYVMRLTV